MPSREALGDQCLYAVILELISKRVLAGVSGTLNDVAKSETVIKYCGRPLAVSTVHYVEKALQNFRYVMTSVRGPKPTGLHGLSAYIFEYISEFGFNEALYVLDLAETIRALHESSAPAWLNAMVDGFGEWLGGHLAGRIILLFLIDYLRRAEHSASTLMTQEITGYTRRKGRVKQLHIKVNVHVNTEPFKKLFMVCLKDKCFSLDQDIKQVADTLEGIMKRGKSVRASQVIPYLRELTSKLYVRYFARSNLLKSAAVAALAYGVHAYVAKLIGEEATKEILSYWDSMGDQAIERKCVNLSEKLRKKFWRVRALSNALANVVNAIKSDGLEQTALGTQLVRWVERALDKGYVTFSHVRVYPQGDVCRVTVTLKINEPIIHRDLNKEKDPRREIP